MTDWIRFEGDELWSPDDRFGVIPVPGGWYCRDQRTNDHSPTFASPEQAVAWAAERRANPPFDGSTGTAARAGYVAPPPPGLNN